MEGPGCRKLFSFPEGQLQLQPDALDLIRAASNLQIVAVMGDGRAGKSHLGNEILGRQAFATSSGGDAMTHGVDIALQGNRLLMDCEGLNNALAPSRAQVLQIGAALASTLIFVLDGKLSEAGLDMLSGVIAQMQLHHKPLPTRLLLVVNKCLLDYGPHALETALESTHGNRGSREAIAGAFAERHFVVVPFEEFKREGYQQALNELHRLVAQDTLKVDGPHLSEMIRSLAVQLRDSICDMPSLHHQIMERFLQTQANAVLQNFNQSLGPQSVEYDPECNIDISGSLRSFEDIVQNLSLGEVAEPMTKRLRTSLEASAQERRRVNSALGDSTANWPEVLRRGCDLLASKRIGARIVVQRRQDLSPLLASSNVIRLDPPVPLSVRWMWHHFHPHLNRESHDFAAVVRDGLVVAVRVAAPALPAGIQPPRGNARHRGALSVSLRSDAWVAVVSEERGETSVACAGELWDAGSSFPNDQNYEGQEQQRRNILMGLKLLWESRRISSSAHGRVHSLKEPWVWDGKAKDEQSGLQAESRHHKSENGAKSHAEQKLRSALQGQGIIWDFGIPSSAL